MSKTASLCCRRRARKGFTLLETLLASFIMVFLVLMTVAVLNTSVSTYNKTLYATNSDVLLTNIRTVLRSELADARDISVATDEKLGVVINYTEGKTGIVCSIYNSSNGIILQKYGEEELLVSSTDGLVSSFTFGNQTANSAALTALNKAIEDNNSITIPKITVFRDGVEYASTENYYIGNR